MTTTEDLQNMEGRTAVDSDGAKLGKIAQIYVDDQSGQPLWVTIQTGMFGTKESFAPLYGSQADGDSLRLAVTKDLVKDAPGIEADGRIEGDENEALYTYYEGHLGSGTSNAPVQDQGREYAGDSREDLSGRDGIQGHDTSGPTTDDAMTRSEERLHVGTEQAEAGRARLRKYVVTENVTQTVPVERVRLGKETVTEDHEVSETLRKEQIDDPDTDSTSR